MQRLYKHCSTLLVSLSVALLLVIGNAGPMADDHGNRPLPPSPVPITIVGR